MEVGPFVSFYFENFDTMLHQVHEMLYAERGGDEQLLEELAAYNPLISRGRELVATMMLEIDDPARRDRELMRLGHIDTTVTLTVEPEASSLWCDLSQRSGPSPISLAAPSFSSRTIEWAVSRRRRAHRGSSAQDQFSLGRQAGYRCRNDPDADLLRSRPSG